MLKNSTSFKRIAPLLWQCLGYPTWRIQRLKYSENYMLKQKRSGVWMLIELGTFDECHKKFLRIEEENEKKI